jgi:Luciferase
MEYLKKIEAEISRWPHTSLRAHRFGGCEFLFGKAEIGHVHTGGVVDIPFPRPIRDALLADGLAQEHHWVPDSGWITFRVRNGTDFQHALWLLRLSFLRYLLKTAADPRELFEQESERLHLTLRFKSLLEPFLPKRAKPVSADPLAA